jgi:tetrahydromethanopterin S-methyltransferase subunit C
MVDVPSRHRDHRRLTDVRDVLLPATDRMVAIQLVAVLTAAVVAMWVTRRERAAVELVAGITLVLVGLMGVRALH